MSSLLLINQLNQGHLRLLYILAKHYNVTIASIINNLIKEYNEIHAPLFISELKDNNANTCSQTPGPSVKGKGVKTRRFSISIDDLCNTLEIGEEQSFINRLLNTDKKLTKEEQIIMIEDAINEISRD